MKYTDYCHLFGPIELSKQPLEVFFHDLENIDVSTLRRQQEAIQEKSKSTQKSLSPPKIKNALQVNTDIFFTQEPVGLIVLAGGQGTRLGTAAPKGTILFDIKTGRSLFGTLAEKLHEHARVYGIYPHLAIMTSTHTHEATIDHFTKNNFFKLPYVDFFIQPSLPLLSLNGSIIIDKSSGHILFGPDGNGSVFFSFYNSPIFQKWTKSSITKAGIIPIDNPLLDPFHKEMFSHVFSGRECAAAAVFREDSQEHVGIFVQDHGTVHVIEYFEMDEETQKTKTPDGKLLYNLANISFFVVTLEAIQKLSHEKTPIHSAKKMVAGEMVYKSEFFIFDHLPFLHDVAIVPIDRDRYFAPVKDLSSFAQAQKKYSAKDQSK